MNGKQILDNFIERHSDLLPYFSGISAINTIEKLPVHNVIICNTSKLGEKGSHWFCIARPSKSEIEIFDSLGANFNLVKEHVKIPGIKNIVGNHTKFQLKTTSTCPLFCLYFAVAKILNQGLPFYELLEEIFPIDDIDKCEKVVQDFHFKNKFYLDK